MKRFFTVSCLLLLMFAAAGRAKAGSVAFQVEKNRFMLGGQPFVVKAAEIHYPRIPRPYWEHRIRMCKALGMNTICIYAFWNIHEQQEGVFDFTGNNDIAHFCRLAQKNGMYVIVRPGPYACAEWEMGGLPWWLLKKKDIRLREQDPYFMERAGRFERQLAAQLSPLTIQNGGNIIMVQVENEYGSYGEDKAYMGAMRDIIREAWGDNVVLFQCDWSSNFWKNGLDDLLWTMNFGTGANIDEQFRKLREMRPDAPLMCSEFWSGWFDKWGARHETRPAEDMVEGIDEMLSKDISFSLYMTHGGTSFGHWAGANSPGFAPDVTSYDYDAPINEYGQPTEKFWLLRNTLQKYSKAKLPAVPKAPMPVISIPTFQLTECAEMIIATDSISVGGLKTFEDMNMGWGTMLYVTDMPEIPVKSVLTINDAHDFAQVFIDGKYIGTVDRVKNEKNLMLPPVKNKNARLAILVEGMGRINFGRAIKDYKGITDNVIISAEVGNHEMTWKPVKWINMRIPDSYEQALQAFNWKQRQQAQPDDKRIVIRGMQDADNWSGDLMKPAYHRGFININKVGDTFLNMEHFGKGQVWVNGHAIGRYWNIGPQQTLYLPGCWLKKGRNEVIVLDVVGPKGDATLFGQDHPELDKLNMEKSPVHNAPGDKPDLNSAEPVHVGQFAIGNGWQRISFGKNAKGRYFALQVISGHDGKDRVAMAELYLLDANGKRISREPWTVKYADSEETIRGNNTADKVFDLQESTYWRTVKGVSLPHLLVIDLGSEHAISGFEYLPRAEEGAPESIKDYRVFMY
ncbi:MAG: beta-galactosidase [Prevotella sp.]|nr:beta-galactosidase [Prevotella sp.]